MTSRENLSGKGGNDERGPRRSEVLREPRVRLDVRTFFGTVPTELMRQFLDGDPLDVEMRCELRSDELCYFIHPYRLYLKSVARCAYTGFRYHGEPPVGEWIAKCIDDAIEDILDEDERGASQGSPPLEDFHYELLADVAGLTQRAAREAYVAFNSLPDEARAAYFALSVHGRTIEEYAAMGGGPPDMIRSNVLMAVMTLFRFFADTKDRGMN